MGRIRELGGPKTSLATMHVYTTRQLCSKFIVYSPRAVASFPGARPIWPPPTNRPGNEAKSAGARLHETRLAKQIEGGRSAPAPGAPPLPTPLHCITEPRPILPYFLMYFRNIMGPRPLCLMLIAYRARQSSVFFILQNAEKYGRIRIGWRLRRCLAHPGSHQLAVRMRIMYMLVPRMHIYTCIACV